MKVPQGSVARIKYDSIFMLYKTMKYSLYCPHEKRADNLQEWGPIVTIKGPHSQTQTVTAPKGGNWSSTCSTDFLVTFNLASWRKCAGETFNITLNSNKGKYISKEKKFPKSELYWLYTLLQITRPVQFSNIWAHVTSCVSYVPQTKTLNKYSFKICRGRSDDVQTF